MYFKLEDIHYALIFGSSKGIGLALVHELLIHNPNLFIFATFHHTSSNQLQELQMNYPDRLKIFKINPLNENELNNLKNMIYTQTKNLDLIINTIGYLHNDIYRPEKSLKDIDLKKLEEDFRVNAFISPLIAKIFKDFLKSKTPSLFVALSAKVGSIQDNQIGGWYGYRASKAALNMFLKNIAIEFKRNNFNCGVIAIHPGTTNTTLSKPFIKNTPYTLHEPNESAKNILQVLEQKSTEELDQFYSWDNKRLPW